MLQEAKELNIPRRNLMSRENLQKATKDIIIKCKEIIFGVDSPVSIECLNELRKQQEIYEIVHNQKHMNDTIRELA